MLAALALPRLVLGVAPNGPCGDAGTVSRFAGAGLTHANVGAQALISSESPLLCTGSDPTHGSFTWVGVEIASSGNAIVQIGVGKCHDSANPSMCNDTYRIFYAWGRQAGQGTCTTTRAAVPSNLGLAPSGSHTYTVVRTSAKVSFQVDGAELTSIFISNVSCWAGNTAAYVAETWDRGDQAGGTVGVHQRVSSALYEATVGGPWRRRSASRGSSSSSYWWASACSSSGRSLQRSWCLHSSVWSPLSAPGDRASRSRGGRERSWWSRPPALRGASSGLSRTITR